MNQIKNNLINVCDKFIIPKEICISKKIVIQEPYIPYFPENWNKILVISEAQNLSKTNYSYVNKLEELEPKKRFLRLYNQEKSLGIGPWDDGTLKLAVASIFSDKYFNNTAVSNAVVWSSVDEKGNNENPDDFIKEKSIEFYKEILSIIKPEILICVGKIARSVIIKQELKCKKIFLRSASKLYLSKVSGMFDKVDLLARFPEVKKVLNKYPNLLNNKYDYMILVDLDNVMKKFNKEGLIKAFSYDLKSWDVLTGNCKNRYYDIWALRLNENNWTSLHSKLWKKCLDYDCWDMLTHKANIGLNEKNIHIKSYQVNIPDDFNLIQVDSAFNGIGIYKVSKINKCKYVGFTQFCSCEKYNCKFGPCTWAKCEHVSFHADMVKKKNAKIFICPQLIIKDQPEHLL